MSDVQPDIDGEEESFGTVTTITPAQMTALEADPEGMAAVRELPDGVVIGEWATVEDDKGTVIAFQCSHPRLNTEELLEVVDDGVLLAEVKKRRAEGGKEWAEEARRAARKKAKEATKAERKAKRQAQRKLERKAARRGKAEEPEPATKKATKKP